MRLHWRPLANTETLSLQRSLFTQGDKMLDTLLRSGAKEDVSALTAALIETSISATRLASQTTALPLPPRHLLPHEVFNKASHRADLIVLPNLLPYQPTTTTTGSEIVFANNSNNNKQHSGGSKMSKTSTFNSGLNITRSPFSLSGSLALGGNNSIKHGLGSTGSSGQVPPCGLVYQKGWNEATATITID